VSRLRRPRCKLQNRLSLIEIDMSCKMHVLVTMVISL